MAGAGSVAVVGLRRGGKTAETERRIAEALARGQSVARFPEYRGSFSKIWHGTGPAISLTGECNATNGEIRNGK